MTEKRNEHSNMQNNDNKQETKFKRTALIASNVLFVLLIVQICYYNFFVEIPPAKSTVMRFEKDVNYVIYHYDKNDNFIGKDSIVFINK